MLLSSTFNFFTKIYCDTDNFHRVIQTYLRGTMMNDSLVLRSMSPNRNGGLLTTRRNALREKAQGVKRKLRTDAFSDEENQMENATNRSIKECKIEGPSSTSLLPSSKRARVATRVVSNLEETPDVASMHPRRESRKKKQDRTHLGLLRLPNEAASLLPPPPEDDPSSDSVIALAAGKFLGRNPRDNWVNTDTHIDIGITSSNGPEVSRQQLVVIKATPTKVILEANPKASNENFVRRQNKLKRVPLRKGSVVTLLQGDCIFFPCSDGVNFAHIFRVHPLPASKPNLVESQTVDSQEQQQTTISEAVKGRRRNLDPPKPSIQSKVLFPQDPTTADTIKKVPNPEPSIKPKASVPTTVAKPSTKSKPVRPPKVGERFRVRWDEGDDFFGQSRPEVGGWWLGTAAAVKKVRGSYRLKIKFEDGQFEEDREISKDVQRLVSSKDGKGFIVAETGEAALTSVDHLELGDLVVGNFQNLGKWHRGRVVAISSIGETSFCSIAYDDHEFEKGIPIAEVLLVERGRDNPSWLNGLTLGKSLPNISSVTKGMKVLFSSSNKKMNYADVVARLGQTVPDRADVAYTWPVLPTLDTTGSTITGDASEDTKIKVVTPSNGARLWRPKNMGVESLDQAGDKVWHQLPLHQDANDDEKLPTQKARHLHTSLANNFWKALNSAEPHLGSSMLAMLSKAHNQVPNEQLCKSVVELITYGPKDGDFLFPDCNRMTLAQSYVSSLLVEQPSMYRELAASAGPGYWKECLENLSTPLSYCADDDESRTSVPAMRRVSQSIHVSASGAQLLADLLEGLLEPCIQNSDSSSLRSLPLVRDIMKEGPRGAVKLAITTMVATWFRHGQYIVDGCPKKDGNDGVPSSLPEDLRLFLVVETKRLFHALGKITSLLIWLWNREEDQTIGDSAILIREAFDKEVLQYRSTYTLKANKKQENAYLQALKFKMVVALDGALLPELKTSLSSVLKVQKLHSAVYSMP